MTGRWEDLLDWAAASPLPWVTLTLAAYATGRWLWLRTGRNAVLQPVLVAVVLVGAVLLVTGTDYATYATGGQLVAFLLGPATVALALPLHRQLATLREAAPAVLTSVALGAAAAAAASVALVRLLGGTEELQLSMAPKSATAPVALALAEQYGGVANLAAVLAVLTGILGAVAGPWVLARARVRDPRAVGLAVGTASHGIGTARVLADDPVQGAYGGLAMALGALATAAALPVVLPLLGL